MDRINLLVLPGDGIGPEIVEAALRVFEAALHGSDVALDVTTEAVGFAALERTGTTYPQGVHDKAEAAEGVLLGPVSHNDYPARDAGGLNPSGELRKRLDLYANIRPARVVPGVPSKLDAAPFDLVIVRENTEGFYADRNMFAGSGEFMPSPDMALAVRKITRQASRRIAEAAFDLAAERRGKVTAVHKANVLRLSDGLFLEECRAVAASRPAVTYEERIVDAMAALLVRDPLAFDVIVTTNMYGDILSDQASEMAGGLGLAASLNRGTNHAVAQAQHGSAPDIAGQDRANPTSLILSGAMLLRWLSTRRDDPRLSAAARRLEIAVTNCLGAPGTRTKDLGGVLGTQAFTDAVLEEIRRD